MDTTIDLTEEYSEVTIADDADGLLSVTIELESGAKLTLFMPRDLFEKVVSAGEELV